MIVVRRSSAALILVLALALAGCTDAPPAGSTDSPSSDPGSVNPWVGDFVAGIAAPPTIIASAGVDSPTLAPGNTAVGEGEYQLTQGDEWSIGMGLYYEGLTFWVPAAPTAAEKDAAYAEYEGELTGRSDGTGGFIPSEWGADDGVQYCPAGILPGPQSIDGIVLGPDGRVESFTLQLQRFINLTSWNDEEPGCDSWVHVVVPTTFTRTE